jgi:prepilin-type N-terminal cleavage/methylation domain-containing protein
VKRLKHIKGFSLLEVLISMVILAGAILVVSSAWSGNFMRLRKSALYNDVATVLERKMVEVEAKYQDKFSEIPEEEAGDFGEDFPKYRWTLKSRDLVLPDMSAAIMGKDGADEMLLTMMKQTTEFLSQSIKEVKVSVFVKTGVREIEYSATQYFIDHTKSFGLGGAGAVDQTGGGTENQGGQTEQPPVEQK